MATREATNRKGRTARIVLVVALALLLLPPGLYLGINAALRGPAPPPAFTERDLPTLPPPDTNGWAVVAENDHRAFRGIDTPTEVLALCRHEDETADRIPPHSEVTARLEVMRAFVARRVHEAAVAELHRALEKPTFVDACSLAIGADCPLTELARAHHLGESEVLIALVEGRGVEAIDEAGRLFRASLSYAGAPRSPVAAVLSVTLLRRDVELGARLVAGLEASAAPRTPELEAAVRAYAARYDQLAEAPLSMRTAIVGDYVSMRSMVLPIFEGGGAAGTDLGLLGRVKVFTDPRDSMRRLDRYYVAMVAFAGGHGRATPPMPDSGAHARGWWLRNPGGKTLLDLGMSNMAPTVVRYEAMVRQVQERRVVVEGALRRWLEGAAVPVGAQPPSRPADAH